MAMELEAHMENKARSPALDSATEWREQVPEIGIRTEL